MTESKTDPRGVAVALLAGTLVALLLAEVLVRFAGVAPDVGYVESWRWRIASNPKLGYEPIPFAKPSGRSQWWGHVGRANSLGFRDREHPLSKPPGSGRIVVIGDSIAWGLRVKNEEDVFTVVLEKELHDGGHSVDVMNFGVSGYNTEQEVETLKDKALAFDPDLVVLAYSLNDDEEGDDGLYRQLLELERGAGHLNLSRLSPWTRHSALFRFLRHRVFAPEVDQPSSDQGFVEDTVTESFRELGRLSEEHGFEVLVVIFPRFDGLRLGRPFPLSEKHERVSRECERNGFGRLDLRAAFMACHSAAPRELLALDVYHPSARGHHCAGEAVARAVANTVNF